MYPVDREGDDERGHALEHSRDREENEEDEREEAERVGCNSQSHGQDFRR